DDHHLEDRYDTFIDHIRKLEEATHKSLIHDTNQEVVLLPQGDKTTDDNMTSDDLVKTVEEIFASPVCSVINQYEKIASEEGINESNLAVILEQMLAQTQYPTKFTKLTAPTDLTLSSNELEQKQQEEIQVIESHDEILTSTSIDQKEILNQDDLPETEKIQPSSIFEKGRSAITDALALLTGATLQSSTTDEITSSTDSSFHDNSDLQAKITATITETTTTTQPAITSETKDEHIVQTSSNDNETKPEDEQIQALATDVLSISVILSSSMIPSTETKVNDTEKHVESSEIVPSPTAGYFSSSDVYHAYKQPIESVVKNEPESSSIGEHETATVSNIISSPTITSVTTEILEETTSASQSPLTDEIISHTVVAESEISVEQPSSNEQNTQQETSSEQASLLLKEDK
ncbi:unnamed protein product, partial [Rotaria magnacalcarata]